MRYPKVLLTAALGIGLAASLGTVPAIAAAPHADQAPTQAAASFAGHAGSNENAAANKAFFDAVQRSVAAKRAANPTLQTVTLIYSTGNAPSFRSQISRSAQIWNSAENNVKLQEGSNADFAYYEGNSSQGSYASTDGHGNGYIFLDYRQNQQYDSIRVVAHETGHVLGLPDHYSGPCSELMSGGGPGTSCRNEVPNATERARVDRLWANGLAAGIAARS